MVAKTRRQQRQKQRKHNPWKSGPSRKRRYRYLRNLAIVRAIWKRNRLQDQRKEEEEEEQKEVKVRQDAIDQRKTDCWSCHNFVLPENILPFVFDGNRTYLPLGRIIAEYAVDQVRLDNLYMMACIRYPKTDILPQHRRNPELVASILADPQKIIAYYSGSDYHIEYPGLLSIASFRDFVIRSPKTTDTLFFRIGHHYISPERHSLPCLSIFHFGPSIRCHDEDASIFGFNLTEDYGIDGPRSQHWNDSLSGMGSHFHLLYGKCILFIQISNDSD